MLCDFLTCCIVIFWLVDVWFFDLLMCDFPTVDVRFSDLLWFSDLFLCDFLTWCDFLTCFWVIFGLVAVWFSDLLLCDIQTCCCVIFGLVAMCFLDRLLCDFLTCCCVWDSILLLCEFWISCCVILLLLQSKMSKNSTYCGCRNFGTHVRVSSPILAHRNSKKEKKEIDRGW